MHSDIDAFAYIHTHFQCCIWYKVHSCALKCILHVFWLHFLSLLHSRAFNPQDAFMCILGMLHSLHVAFQRILMHSQLDAFSNVLHLVHVIHSCALPYVCILNVMHISAFRCMHMRCILMHSNYDAFMCITVCMHSERDAFTRISMHANALHSNAF